MEDDVIRRLDRLMVSARLNIQWIIEFLMVSNTYIYRYYMFDSLSFFNVRVSEKKK